MTEGRAARGGWRRVILATTVLAMGFVVVPPTQAKTPSRSPESTVKCANGKKAKVWWKGTKHVETVGDEGDFTYWELTEWAVDNKCKNWLQFTVTTEPLSESDCCLYFQVAPGASFTKTAKDYPLDDISRAYGQDRPFGVTEEAKKCQNPNGDHHEVTRDFDKKGNVTPTEDCPRKYPESDSRSIGCPESFDRSRGDYTKRASGVWKVDSKKIIKLAANNQCEFEMIFWWKTKDGKRISLWVDEKSSFDFWKAELDPLPVKTKDGAVHYIDGPRMSPTTMDLAAYDENWRIYQGRPYLWSRG